MTSRIGLLGGTFDPIHLGHIAILKTALQQLKLDKMFLIPAGDPWQKQPITSPQHRLAMTKLATESISNVEVLDLEINRSGPTYTFETLEELHKKYEDTELEGSYDEFNENEYEEQYEKVHYLEPQEEPKQIKDILDDIERELEFEEDSERIKESVIDTLNWFKKLK